MDGRGASALRVGPYPGNTRPQTPLKILLTLPGLSHPHTVTRIEGFSMDEFALVCFILALGFLVAVAMMGDV